MQLKCTEIDDGSPSSDDQSKRGAVQIIGLVDGELRKVEVDLTGETWELAHRAINSNRLLACDGDLVKSKTFVLRNARHVELLTGD